MKKAKAAFCFFTILVLTVSCNSFAQKNSTDQNNYSAIKDSLDNQSTNSIVDSNPLINSASSSSDCTYDNSSSNYISSSINVSSGVQSSESSSSIISSNESSSNNQQPSEYNPLEERISDGIIPTKSQLDAVTPYKRIVIIGIDGAGGVFENVDCPNFKRIFSEGNVNCHGISQYPTISAQNWCSMMYGVTAQTHNKTNDLIETTKHNNSSLPSVIKTCSELYSDKTFYSIVGWKPINYGCFEDMDRLTKINTIDLHPNYDWHKIDESTSELVIQRMKDCDDLITFVHFESVDQMGHNYGGVSDQYFDAIKHVDTLIGSIYDAYARNNKLESTLFICVSDHGHTSQGGHGGETDSEKETTLAVCDGGTNIIKGNSGKYVTHDLASIIMYALGQAQPRHYEGGVPKNLFKGL